MERSKDEAVREKVIAERKLTVPPPQQRTDTFWTVCHRCKIQYEYYRIYLNQTLLCPKCREAFLASETPVPKNYNPSTSSSSRTQAGAAQSSQPKGSVPSSDTKAHQPPFSSNASVAGNIVQQACESLKRQSEELHVAGGCEKLLEKKRRLGDDDLNRTGAKTASSNMECRKGEAVRAKVIAERKLMEKDYTGAKKFALKAQELYPGLDGLTQLYATLEVYLSGETKVIGEVDWYSVLGVSLSADGETMRKQYHRLALRIHPDKNKSIGAEGAFKLLSAAWSVLSDKTKRQAYVQRFYFPGVFRRRCTTVHRHHQPERVLRNRPRRLLPPGTPEE